MKHSFGQSLWQVENLETRQLLSVSVGGGVEALLTPEVAVVEPLRVTSIVGTFNGTTKQGRKSAKSLQVNVTSESRKGAIAGTTVTSNGTGNFTGSISGSTFTMTSIQGRGNDTVVNGTISNGGRTLSGTWVNGSQSGTFTVSR